MRVSQRMALAAVRDAILQFYNACRRHEIGTWGKLKHIVHLKQVSDASNNFLKASCSMSCV